MMSSARLGRSLETRSAENSAVECNGSKPLEMQLQLQQEELSRMQQEQAQLREELVTQKVLLTGKYRHERKTHNGH